MTDGGKDRTRFLRAVAASALLALALAAHQLRVAQDPLVYGAAVAAETPGPAHAAKLPAIKHVFTIVLENKDYAETFGADSAAPYLAKRLTAKGQLLSQYHGTGHLSLGNYITMISGQAENIDTQADCLVYTEMIPGTIVAGGQALGQGCVYPATVQTIVDEIRGTRRYDWRGYMEDMGKDPSRERKRCGHPAVGSADGTQNATAEDQYATRHNPFMYFHSIIDSDRYCRKHVVPLPGLRKDLRRPRTTRNYTFITPDLCSDGHDEECVNPEQHGGYEGINDFLKHWVPLILRSPAYSKNGLLIVTFDESESGGGACCFVPTGPNTPQQGFYGPGGGRTGTVLISPWVKPGSVNDHPYNHYDMLRTVEDIFGVDHLGYSARPEVEAFGHDVFSKRRR